MNNFSLDQLRFFVMTAQEGSFAAASRKLFRVQSAISYGIAKLESDLGVHLFIRKNKGLILTPEGTLLLEKARLVIRQSDELYQKAKALHQGEETELSLSVDQLISIETITHFSQHIDQLYPQLSVHLHQEVLGENIALLLTEQVQFSITSYNVSEHPEISRIPVGTIQLCTVVHKDHPLSKIPNPNDQDLQRYNQIIVRDRSARTEGKNFSVLGKKNWSVANMYTKKRLIQKGLGWGNLPTSDIQKECEEGLLVEIQPSSWQNLSLSIPMVAVHKKSIPLSDMAQKAIQWFQNTLSEEQEPSPE